MTPLIFAAALALSPTNAPPSQYLDPSPIPPAVQERLEAARACERLATLAVAPNGVPFRKLNELPQGVPEHAVWRTVEGCPVREVIYKGQTYYVDPAIPKFDSEPLQGRIARHR